MDDNFEELNEIFNKKIEEIKGYNYEQLKALCEEENIDYEDLNEEELKEAVINYFKEELDD